MVMLTGDGRTAAAAVGQEVGISEIHSELLPDMKLAAIQRLQKAGRRVTMVGDGINDAAALAQADAGLAIGVAPIWRRKPATPFCCEVNQIQLLRRFGWRDRRCG